MRAADRTAQQGDLRSVRGWRRARCALLLGMAALALVACELGLRLCGYGGAAERLSRRFDPKYGTVNADSWIFDFAIDPRRHRASTCAAS